MKRLLLTLILIFSLSSITIAEQFPAVGSIDVYFSPHGGATEAVVREIDGAKMRY